LVIFESIFTRLVVPTPFIFPKGIVCVPIRVGGFPFVILSVKLWIEDGSGILFFILFTICKYYFCEYYFCE